MSVKSDKWIRRMALEHGMIEPFTETQVRSGVISYGLSSYGYDARVADELLYAERFEQLGVRLLLSTNDGSRGVKGFVTDAIRRPFGRRSLAIPDKVSKQASRLVRHIQTPLKVTTSNIADRISSIASVTRICLKPAHRDRASSVILGAGSYVTISRSDKLPAHRTANFPSPPP